MDNLATLSELLRHGDIANEMVIRAASTLSDEQLDRPLDLGMGSLRLICQHLLAGEVTWIARITGDVEAKWPARPIPNSPADMQDEFRATAASARKFIAALTPDQLHRMQSYRDSRGSLFQATLHQMLLQFILHSTHHRAQIVNAIRRVGGKPPEVDYMSLVRRPAP